MPRILQSALKISLYSCLLTMTACSAIVENQTNKFTDNLSSTILNFEDPETVKAATPTFLILIDSVARGEDANGATQMTAAQMFGSFAGAFVTEPQRQKVLANKAWQYAQSGSCKIDQKYCQLNSISNNEFKLFIDNLSEDDAKTSYAYAVAWLGYIQTHSDDWTALAQLAKAQAVLEKVVIFDETIDNAGPHLYLGAIASTLPPALGGKPAVAKTHFLRAIELTQGQSLLVKVEYARRYARTMFDKELHHQLLIDVINSPVKAEGLTLMNAWAQDQAELLLASEDEYFD